MTYKELLNKILTLTPEEQDQDVTVYLTGQDEYITISAVVTTDDTDVLDSGHVVLNVPY
jgi:hypothetical protein